MTNSLVNNCPNTVKHQASATQDKARQQIRYLLVRQTVPGGFRQSYITQSFAYGPWYGNGTEAILHMKSHCSAPIFKKLLFYGKTAYPNPNPDVQLLYNATLRKQHVSHGLSRSYWILKLTNVACHPWVVYKLLGAKERTGTDYIGNRGSN